MKRLLSLDNPWTLLVAAGVWTVVGALSALTTGRDVDTSVIVASICLVGSYICRSIEKEKSE